jgi:hypothetical protein
MVPISSSNGKHHFNDDCPFGFPFDDDPDVLLDKVPACAPENRLPKPPAAIVKKVTDTDTDTDTECFFDGDGDIPEQFTVDELLHSAADMMLATDPPVCSKQFHNRKQFSQYTSLIHLCWALQALVGDDYFYLDCRRAAKHIGVRNPKTTWCMFRVLCGLGILKPGETGNRNRSNRYKFIG